MTVAVGSNLILMVEDDDGMRGALASLLRVAGFETRDYDSAEALLGGGELENALCVISDVHLPLKSGLELLSELQARAAQVPVIIMTAYDSESSRQEAAQRGAVGYLAKPFPGSELLSLIQGICAQRAAP